MNDVYTFGNDENLDGKIHSIILDITYGKYKIKHKSYVSNRADECITVVPDCNRNIIVTDLIYKKPSKKAYLEYLPDSYKNRDNRLCDDICPICLDKFRNSTVRKLECGHVYHKKCIDKWLYQYEKKECPYCRK
jgi:hypothetical protein